MANPALSGRPPISSMAFTRGDGVAVIAMDEAMFRGFRGQDKEDRRRCKQEVPLQGNAAVAFQERGEDGKDTSGTISRKGEENP